MKKNKKIEDGDLVETYTIGHLLRKKILVKNSIVWDDDQKFRFENVVSDPGFNDGMLKGVFGTTLRVSCANDYLEGVFFAKGNDGERFWYLPHEIIKR